MALDVKAGDISPMLSSVMLAWMRRALVTGAIVGMGVRSHQVEKKLVMESASPESAKICEALNTQ